MVFCGHWLTTVGADGRTSVCRGGPTALSYGKHAAARRGIDYERPQHNLIR
jgi:hypothetical protein